VVADVDGDGWWDVLQPGAAAGILWRGGARGFEPPVASTLAGRGLGHWTLGDFNQDGFLDIFLAGESDRALWENNGRGEFNDVTLAAGSLSYKLPPGIAGCLAADLNHDGRTDLGLCYAKSAFLYHFNRGFRCFGEEGEVRLPEGEGGQQACAVADFNGDGSLDLAVALANRQLRCYYNRAAEQPMLGLSLKPGRPGPVTVSLWPVDQADASLGTYNVHPHPVQTIATPRGSGPFVLKWRMGGGPERIQTITLPSAQPPGSVNILLE
jgi:hypothetical protein